MLEEFHVQYVETECQKHNYWCLLKFKNIMLDSLSALVSDCIMEYCSNNETFDTLDELKKMVGYDTVAYNNNRIPVFKHLLKYCLDISRNLDLYRTNVAFCILDLYLDKFIGETYEFCGKFRKCGHLYYRPIEVVEFCERRESTADNIVCQIKTTIPGIKANNQKILKSIPTIIHCIWLGKYFKTNIFKFCVTPIIFNSELTLD